jgi:translocation and assembly module TamB
VVLPWYRRPLLICIGALGTGVVGVAAADQLAERSYNHWKPRLEPSLSALLGQTLQLGPYRGLTPWGLRLGPTRLLPRGDNRSSLSSESLRFTLAPLASLRQGVVALQLELGPTRAELRANRRGLYWQPGPRRPPQTPPRLELALRLQQPVRLQLQPSGGRYDLAGQLRLRLDRRELELATRLRPRNRQQGGAIQAAARGNWARQSWSLELGVRQLAVADLAALLPARPPANLPGLVNGGLQLQWRQRQPHCRGQLRFSALAWPNRRRPGAGLAIDPAVLRCQQQTLALKPTTLRWNGLQAQASGQVRWQGGRYAELEQLELRSGRSWIRTRGRLGATPQLLSQLRLQPIDLPSGNRLPAWWRGQPLQGTLTTQGSWRQPRLALAVQRSADPLLGPWQASLSWQQNSLTLHTLNSTYLQASGSLPLGMATGRGLVAGALQLELDLSRYPLKRLQPVVGARLGGELQARGRLSGPLTALMPAFELEVNDLAAGPLGLNERWRGRLQGRSSGGGQLQMTSLAPAPVARLRASLNRRWLPAVVELQRLQGQLSLQGEPNNYRWQARSLPLDGLILSLGPRQSPQPVLGRLSGSGQLDLQPLAFNGTVELERPALLGVRAQQASLRGRYEGGRYQLNGTVLALDRGSLAVTAQGRWQGPFQLAVQARSLGSETLQQLAGVGPRWRGQWQDAGGRARDLGALVIDTMGQSLQQQLAVLSAARERLAARNEQRNGVGAPLAQRLSNLQTQIDADLSLAGPSLARARLDLAGKGHLWWRQQDRDLALAQDPFEVRLRGPVSQGSGSLSLSQLPLSLLALLTPVPEGLRGSLSVAGRYGLGRQTNDLNLQLSLQQAGLGDTDLDLRRGVVLLRGETLQLDLALQAAGADSSVDLAGTLPLNPNRDGLELRLASRGDGLRFLTLLAEPGLSWRRGSADLQLLLRGSLSNPIANGFLRLRQGQLGFIGQTVDDLEATVVFDFNQLLVQELSARVGERGRLQASGNLGLLQPTATEPPLEVELVAVPFNLPRIAAVADGRLRLEGSLRDLQMGGELAIDKGSINAQRGRLAASRPGQSPQAPRKGVAQLLQENWDFQQPLLLVGAEVESNTNQAVQESVPRFPFLGFNDLRLKLGPQLRIQVPNVASFTTAGLLRLSGRLDPSLRARGVVRLLQGRLNLFTTSFSLDPDAPNVAIFTPSLGLVPYIDIALRTRVSDSLATAGLGTAGVPSLAEIEAQGGLTSLNQLNLVRITVSVSGPADRLAQSIRLRSSPPLPESRLVALIGGNSLAGLSGAGAGAAIATVVGQSLLSPVLGGLSDAFGQRLSFALYPAYVNPTVTSQEALQSRRLAPVLVLGAEVGLDITERFNASVLAAPNRSDVPPQINLNLRASDLINIQGAVDTQGAWQTQLQLFFRF